MTERQPRWWILVAATCVLLGLLAGCGSDPTSGASSPTQASPAASSPAPSAATSPGCEEATALRNSLEALKNVNVRSDGVDALNSAIDDVKADLEAARTSASSVLRPELDQVKTALDALQSATTGVTKDNLAQRAPQIATALTQVATATAAFAATLATKCPAS